MKTTKKELEAERRASELLPCPFCGGEELEICNTHTAKFWVECPCGAEKHGKYMEGETKKHFSDAIQSAITGWNTRNPRSAECPTR